MGAWLSKTERNPEKGVVQTAVPGERGKGKERGSKLTLSEHLLLTRHSPRAVAYSCSPFRGHFEGGVIMHVESENQSG